MSNNIKVILFDLGGVLIELTGMSTILSWSDDAMTSDLFWEQWLTSQTVRDFETGRIHHDCFAEQLIEEMSLSVKPEKFLDEFTYWPNGLFPGVKELINRIPSAYTLATLSNTNALHWPRIMDEMGIANLFEHYFASHLMGKLKPDLEVFEHVVETLDCEPSAILFVDDNRQNVEAARTLGIQAIETKGINAVEQVLEDYEII